MALAGGVNALIAPESFTICSRWGMLAPDGRCKTFDPRADGFVRGEGCGIVVLKRLSDALRDGDGVLAIIRGSAVNQDGASSGLTVPNGLAQEKVIRQALAAANVQPEDVSYVEAHGAGTSLGDPIELEALLAVLGERRPVDRPLIVGSAKTNLGHLEAAAGVAGLLKVVLALQHGEIPPHLNFASLTPRVTLGSLPLMVPTRRTPWPVVGGRRLAGVSSFGVSGSNAHLIVEGPPTPTPLPAKAERSHHLLVVSARTEAALQAQAARLARYLDNTPAAGLGDIGFTLATGRTRFERRLAVVAGSTAQAGATLTQVAKGAVPAVTGQASRRAPGVAFLFTGQGAHWPGMGRELYEQEPAFRAALDRCAMALRDVIKEPLLEVLWGNATDRLEDTPSALFAIEYALAELWRAWGVQPAAVLGHSAGEYAAACVAGVLEVEDGARLIAARGRLIGALPPGGMMAAAWEGESRVREIISSWPAVDFAAVNGPSNVVISGPVAAVEEACRALEAREIKTERLRVSYAGHSSLLDPMLGEFASVAAGVKYRPPTVPFVSSLLGRAATAAEVARPEYWVRQTRESVRFGDAVRSARDAGCTIFVETGPHPVLAGLGQLTVDDATWVGTLRRGRGSLEQAIEAAGTLWTRGVAVNLARVQPGRRLTGLPTYPFQPDRHWVERSKDAAPQLPPPVGGHPLLGRRLGLAAVPGTAIWEGRLTLAELPYLSDHRVEGRVIVPATAYLEMMHAAAGEVFPGDSVELRDIRLEKPIFLADDAVYRVQLTLRREGDDRASVQIHGVPAGNGDVEPEWTLHATAHVGRSADSGSHDRLDDIRERCGDEVSGAVFYARLAERGNEWGQSFRGVTTIWRGDDEALSEVRVPEILTAECGRYRIHPAVADAAGHVLAATIPLEGSTEPLGGAFVGGGIDRIRFCRPPHGSTLWSHARRRFDTGDTPNVLSGDVTLYDHDGVVAELEGAHLWYLAGAGGAARDVDDWFYEVTWPHRPRAALGPAPPGYRGAWLVLADTHGAGDRLAESLTAYGCRCVVAVPGPSYERLGATRFMVRPSEPDDLARLIVEGTTESSGPWTGIVHLWSLEAPGGHDLSPAGLDIAASLMCTSLVALVSALQGLRLTSAPRLWLVSRGAQRLGGEQAIPAVAQSLLWGLGRSLAMEHADLWGALVDLDPDVPATDGASALVAELREPDGEDQMAFRGGRRYAARLTRRPRMTRPKPEASCSADGTYLVTGGLGGLGLLVASWLVDRGARHLALVGRTGLRADDRRHDAIRAMEGRGAAVRVVAMDVGDAAAIDTMLKDLRDDGWPAVRGLVHAAGVMRYRPLADTTPADVAEVLRAKVRGAWLLHAALADAPLDFFVLFSSGSAVLSSAMIAVYAAGNAFLDGLAQCRRAQGRPAVSINWGLWIGAGMAEAVDGSELAEVVARGMGAIDPDRGLLALRRVLHEDPVQVAVLPVDWTKWFERYPTFSESPLLKELVNGSRGSVMAADSVALKTLLRGATPPERRRMVGEYFVTQLAAVLRLDIVDIDATVPIRNLGIDSLMSVELKNRLERALGVSVPMARLLEGPSAVELAEQLNTLIVFEQDAIVSPEVATALLERLDDLSEEEVETLLAQMSPVDQGQS